MLTIFFSWRRHSSAVGFRICKAPNKSVFAFFRWNLSFWAIYLPSTSWTERTNKFIFTLSQADQAWLLEGQFRIIKIYIRREKWKFIACQRRLNIVCSSSIMKNTYEKCVTDVKWFKIIKLGGEHKSLTEAFPSCLPCIYTPSWMMEERLQYVR